MPAIAASTAASEAHAKLRDPLAVQIIHALTGTRRGPWSRSTFAELLFVPGFTVSASQVADTHNGVILAKLWYVATRRCSCVVAKLVACVLVVQDVGTVAGLDI